MNQTPLCTFADLRSELYEGANWERVSLANPVSKRRRLALRDALSSPGGLWKSINVGSYHKWEYHLTEISFLS